MGLRRSLLTTVLAVSFGGCSPAEDAERTLATTSAASSDPFFVPNTVHAFGLTIPPAGIASLTTDPKTPVAAVFTYGATNYDVTVRLKGALGSLRPIGDKPAFKVKFAKGQEFFGLRNLTLNNMVQDQTMTHEVLAYEVYAAAGVAVPRAGYANVTVNGAAYGLYLNLETIDGDFLKRVFGNKNGVLYEGAYGVDLRASDLTKMDLEEGDDPQNARLASLVAALDAPGDGVFYGPNAKVETAEFLNMMAVSAVIVDWDNYYSANNYRIYEHPTTKRWSFVPTGTDQTFKHAIDVFGASGRLFQKCLATEKCIVDYAQRVALVTTKFENLGLGTKKAALEAVIANAVLADTKKPYTAAQMTAARAAFDTFLVARPNEVRSALGCVVGQSEIYPGACAGTMLVNASGGTCLDVLGESTLDGADTNGWSCHGKANQRWDFVPSASPGYVKIVSRRSRRCLDLWASDLNDGADVRQYACHGNDNQLWAVTQTPTGMQITSKLSGKCLDLNNGSTADGTSTLLWTCHGGKNQRWVAARSPLP